MLGTLVNTAAVVGGSLIGLLLKKGIPERVSDHVMKGLGLCVLYIGIDGVLSGSNALIAILSIVAGAVIGHLLDLEAKLANAAASLEMKFKSGAKNSIAEGFVTASLLFCVGSMAVVGSIQSGLSGDHEMLFTKSALDFCSSLIFSASLGIGVILAAGTVLVYQGSITLLAQWIAPYMNDYTVDEMTCVGSLLIIGLALNMLNITDLKIMNYLPAVFLPILFCLFL